MLPFDCVSLRLQGSYIEEKIYPLVLPPPLPRPMASLATGCLGGVRVAEGRSGTESDADSDVGAPRRPAGAAAPGVGAERCGGGGAVAAGGVEIDGLALAEALLEMAPEDAEREACTSTAPVGLPVLLVPGWLNECSCQP